MGLKHYLLLLLLILPIAYSTDLQNGLHAVYKFDNNCTDFYAGNDCVSLYTNQSSDSAEGSSSLLFDGKHSRVNITTFTELQYNWTVSFYFRVNSTNSANVLIGTTVPVLEISVMTNKSLYTHVGSKLFSSPVISTGTWHYLTLTRDTDSNYTLYINGTYKYKGKRTNSLANRIFSLGWYLTEHLNGSIDMLTIYNRSLTPSDISLLYSLNGYPLSRSSIQLNFSSKTAGSVYYNISRDGLHYSRRTFNSTNNTFRTNFTYNGDVIFELNNGTQYYEYYMNSSTNISENIFLIANPNTIVYPQVLDESYSILEDSIIEIYYTPNDGEDKLVDRIYGSGSKYIMLERGKTYTAKAFRDDYELIDIIIFKPEQLISDSLVLTMKTTVSNTYLQIEINQPNILFFNSTETTKNIILSIDSSEQIQDLYVVWDINGSNRQTVSRDYIKNIDINRDFTTGDGQHEIYVYISDELEKKFIIKEKTVTTFFTLSQGIKTSRLAFLTFLIFVLSCAGFVQHHFKDYGKETLTGLSVIFSFLNYFMVIIAGVMLISIVTKKAFGDQE